MMKKIIILGVIVGIVMTFFLMQEIEFREARKYPPRKAKTLTNTEKIAKQLLEAYESDAAEVMPTINEKPIDNSEEALFIKEEDRSLSFLLNYAIAEIDAIHLLIKKCQQSNENECIRSLFDYQNHLDEAMLNITDDPSLLENKYMLQLTALEEGYSCGEFLCQEIDCHLSDSALFENLRQKVIGSVGGE